MRKYLVRRYVVVVDAARLCTGLAASLLSTTWLETARLPGALTQYGGTRRGPGWPGL